MGWEGGGGVVYYYVCVRGGGLQAKQTQGLNRKELPAPEIRKIARPPTQRWVWRCCVLLCTVRVCKRKKCSSKANTEPE